MAGSLGYADRLKNRKKLGGQLGATEYMEDVQTVKDKVRQLADMISEAKQVFLFTGAGISTSAGIPDFRGPNGIWTLRKKKQPISAPLTPFEHAKPTLTHMVIAALVASGKASMVCSQNVDSLHLRSGVPRSKLAELHGNCFAERCSTCKWERVRDFQVETLNFRPTGRTCTRPGCGGVMVDNVLDWDSALPDDELDASLEAAQAADVCLVLGSSLQIQPANEIPLHTADSHGKVVIVNLQKTPRDRQAALILRARVDAVMALLATQLGLTLPPYVRLDGVVVSHTHLATQQQPPLPLAAPAAHGTAAGSDSAHAGIVEEQAGFAPLHAGVGGSSKDSESHGNGSQREGWGFRLLVGSVHGLACVLPMVQGVTLRVEVPCKEEKGQEGIQGAGSVAVQVARVGCKVVPASQQEQQQQQQQGQREQQQLQQEPVQPGQHVPPGALPAGGQGVSATAHTPGSSGGVPLGGPYEFMVTGLPPAVQQVACHMQLHLVEWADEDKRDVRLPAYHVTQQHARSPAAAAAPAAAAGAPAEARAAGVKVEEGGKKLEGISPAQLAEQPVSTTAGQGDATAVDVDVEVAAVLDAAGLSLPCQAPPHLLQELQAAAAAHDAPHQQQHQQQQQLAGAGHQQHQQPGLQGNHVSILASTPQTTIYTFITQVVQYDVAAIWQAYEADPPPVVMPVQRKRKASTGDQADGAGCAADQQLRRSARRRMPTAAAAAAGAVDGDGDEGEDGVDSEDGGAMSD